MKLLALIFPLFFTQQGIAQHLPLPDSVSTRYAANDTAAVTATHLHYSLIKFNVNPGTQIHQYGVIKIISPVHFIVRLTNFDSSLQKQVIYNYPANNNWKASTNLLQRLSKLKPTDSITFQVTVKSNKKIQRVTIQQQDWNNFIKQPQVLFADIIRIPKGEILINNSDPGANAVSTAQQQYPGIRGKNIVVSLKEELPDTADIDFKGRYLPSAEAAVTISSHATIMATTIGGAGNNGLKSLGAAPEVKFVSADFNTSLAPEDDTYFQRYAISLQNHSYGTGIENYYGMEAVAYDEQVYTADTILHVFSSGNIGTTSDNSGPYQGLQYANLSGSFKQAKNVLVVGGSNDSLRAISLSSKGPAYDGRVKPELMAFGADGTSGAAAITTGVSALVQDAYKQQYGHTPSAAFVKALLVNSVTKTDAGSLTYAGGYGNLNALAALKTLSSKHFFSGKGTQQFTITVPPGMQRLSVTLCWNDPPAAVNSSKALINDLDLSITGTQGQTILPWVLSAAADSLAFPARRGKDSLNTLEQITIDNPAAGDIQIRVTNPVAGQSFHLVYDWTPLRTFTWLNPGNHEVLLAGGLLPLPIRWESNLMGKGDLFYSLDSAKSWIAIGTQLSASQGLFYWAAPNVFSAALLKLVTRDTTIISDTFYLSPRLSVETGYDCGDNAFIYWSSLQDATSYDVFQLGDEYLAPYTPATDTFLLLSNTASPYFAVSPVHKDGWNGLKSYGTNYHLQGTGCYVKTLLADIITDNQVLLSLTLGTSYNLKNIYWERYSGNGYITLSEAAVNGVNYTYADDKAPSGVIYYRVKLVTLTGKIIYSTPVPVYMLNDKSYLLFPNPVQNTLHILSKTPAQLQVYDMSGKLLLRKQLNDQVESIWMGDLPAGIYNCVLFSNGQKVFTKQIIKI